jgi:hypothetical protein
MRANRVYVASLTAICGSFLVLPIRSEAQQPANRPPAQQPTQRLQGTRDMRVACVGADSTRVFRRGVGGAGDTTLVARRMAGDTSTRAITGGTEGSRQYPEYDVVLDVPNLCVERIFLKVDTVSAKINLNAQIANLVTVRAGADVLIGNVDLTIQDVRARALLLVDLDDVVHIVDNTLTFIDNHPEIISQLGSTLQNTVGAVGGLVRGLVLGVTRLANGNTLQRVVNEATGDILERTLSAAGGQLAERVVGSVLRLPTLRETTNAAGQVVRQVRDQAGSLLEYTLDKATNKILGVRLLQGVTR